MIEIMNTVIWNGTNKYEEVRIRCEARSGQVMWGETTGNLRGNQSSHNSLISQVTNHQSVKSAVRQ